MLHLLWHSGRNQDDKSNAPTAKKRIKSSKTHCCRSHAVASPETPLPTTATVFLVSTPLSLASAGAEAKAVGAAEEVEPAAAGASAATGEAAAPAAAADGATAPGLFDLERRNDIDTQKNRIGEREKENKKIVPKHCYYDVDDAEKKNSLPFSLPLVRFRVFFLRFPFSFLNYMTSFPFSLLLRCYFFESALFVSELDFFFHFLIQEFFVFRFFFRCCRFVFFFFCCLPFPSLSFYLFRFFLFFSFKRRARSSRCTTSRSRRGPKKRSSCEVRGSWTSRG